MKFLFALFLGIAVLFANVNINTAGVNELIALKGIGKTKAKAIIKCRKKHSFNKKEDIMNVKGIGKKTFKKIKDEISVGE